MKKYRQFYLLLLFTGCLFACKNDSLKPEIMETSVVNIDMFRKLEDNSPQKINISDFIDSVRLIKLDNTVLLRGINRVFVDDNILIVFDRGGRQVVIYDTDGTLINSISKQGRAEDEYVTCNFCMYDKKTKQIIISDLGSRKMLFYDLHGNFIKKISNFSDDALFRDIINLPNGNFLCYMCDKTESETSKKANGLWEVDSLGNFVRSYFTYKHKLPVILGEYTYFNSLTDNSIELRDGIFSDIYKYEDNKLERKIIFNIKDNNLGLFVDRELSVDNSYSYNRYTHSKKGYKLSSWFEENGSIYYSLFSDKDNSIKFAKEITYDMPIIPQKFIDIDCNKTLLIPITGIDVLNYLNDSKIPEAFKAKYQIFANNDNPILQLLYLK